MSGIREVGGVVTFDLEIAAPSALLRYWGDVNRDGMIGRDDAAEVSRYLMTGETTADLTVADVDASGAVDQRDALVILSWYDAIESFLLTPFRVGTAVGAAGPALQRAPRKPEPAP